MKFLSILLFAIFFTANSVLADITAITVVEKDGVTTNNYPLTFGHIFKQGDAPSNVYVKINGTSIPTQCDVKSTYDDGSIRFAVISLLIPTVPSNGSVVLNLESGGTNYNTDHLTKSEIQATNIDAQIALTGLSGSGYSGDLTADLSTAITDTTNLQYWLSGNIATEVIVQQRLNSSLNAVWEVRIYPGTNYKRISHTIENIEANYRGNVTYAVGISQGIPSLTSVYTKGSFQHNQSSRWRKVLWVGTEPPEVEIHYNLPYLISTGIIPNYHTNLVVPEGTLSSSYAYWGTTDHDIMGNGVVNVYFPQTGGREEIGFFPTWTARYLISMDNRMREVMLNSAEMASSCPMHYREFNPTKTFYGKFINIDDRPKVRTTDNYSNDASYDALGPAIGELTTEWTIDGAHQGSFNFVPYIITGEYYYLQELQYWAAWDLSMRHFDSSWGRNYSEGRLEDQVRGIAWMNRNLAHAAIMSVDGSPEKLYFTDKVNNNIAYFSTRADDFPLRNMGDSTAVDGQFLGVSRVASGWMDDFCLIVFSEIDRLGFDTENIVSELSKFTIGRFYGTDFNPYNGDSYRFPTMLTNGSQVSTWSQANALYPTPDKSSFPSINYTYGYRHIALAALAESTSRPNGLAAYNWLKDNLNCSVTMDSDPTWAIAPRYNNALNYIKLRTGQTPRRTGSTQIH